MDPDEGGRLSVIIPVLNDAEGLRRCLASLRREGVPSSETEVIVVDNGSTDATLEVARQGGATALVLPRLRVGELRNRGASIARGRLLAFVDADHEIAPGWVTAACSLCSEDRVAAIGAQYSPPSPGSWVQRSYGRLRGRASGRHDTEWLGSGNMVVRRHAFWDVRGFDRSLDACEDVDLCQRLRVNGWRLLNDERLGSVHHGDPRTLRSLFKSEMWRGRDNVKVSLRSPTWRGLPSVLIPVVDLACVALFLAGLFASLLGAATGWFDVRLALSAAGIVAALVLVRAARIMASPGPGGPREWSRAIAVAATYDFARALALVLRQPHRRR